MVLRLRVALAAAACLVATPAWAFHEVGVTEVFPGTGNAPNAQFVELEMVVPGQNDVSGHSLQVFNASGTVIGTFTFSNNVANGLQFSRILIATAEAEALFGVTPDLTMTAVIPPTGGKVCWTGSGDCMAWGKYAGPSAGVGAPFSPEAGLLPCRSATRRRTGLFSVPVDTDDSASDFRFQGPSPVNNAGQGAGLPASQSCPPVVAVAATTPTATEVGLSPGTFTVSRAGADLTTALMVNYTVGGSATPGSDYTALSGTVTIPAFSNIAAIPVVPLDDNMVEGDETVTVTLGAGTGYVIGASATATVTIVSDDGSVTLTVTKSGSGSGTVISIPPGIDCGTVCSRPVLVGSVVGLAALSGPDSAFGGWGGGGCTGTGPCTVTVTGDTSVSATFNRSVARSADFDGDGKADIVTGAGAGGGPHVRVVSGADGREVLSFFAYDPAFAGGVRVAVCDLNLDGVPDIVTGPGPGGGPHVRAFDGRTGAPLPGAIGSFFAYDAAFAGGVFVGCADVNGDGVPDILTAPGPGGGPHVRAFSGVDGGEILGLIVYDAAFAGGVFVAP